MNTLNTAITQELIKKPLGFKITHDPVDSNDIEFCLTKTQVDCPRPTVPVAMALSWTCNAKYSGLPTEGATIMEVIGLSYNNTTVIDVDLGDDVKSEEVDRIVSQHNRGGDLDAVVMTGRGVQLVYLRPGVISDLQDDAYESFSEERGMWDMRTHNKTAEEAASPLQPAGQPRRMIGLTVGGMVLAQEWNKMVALASQIREQRIAAGYAHVTNGVLVPPTWRPTFNTQKQGLLSKAVDLVLGKKYPCF